MLSKVLQDLTSSVPCDAIRRQLASISSAARLFLRRGGRRRFLPTGASEFEARPEQKLRRFRPRGASDLRRHLTVHRSCREARRSPTPLPAEVASKAALCFDGNGFWPRCEPHVAPAAAALTSLGSEWGSVTKRPPHPSDSRAHCRSLLRHYEFICAQTEDSGPSFQCPLPGN